MVGASYLWSWEMSQSRRVRAEGIGDEGVRNQASKTQCYDPVECRISGVHCPGVLEVRVTSRRATKGSSARNVAINMKSVSLSELGLEY